MTASSVPQTTQPAQPRRRSRLPRLGQPVTDENFTELRDLADLLLAHERIFILTRPNGSGWTTVVATRVRFEHTEATDRRPAQACYRFTTVFGTEEYVTFSANELDTMTSGWARWKSTRPYDRLDVDYVSIKGCGSGAHATRYDSIRVKSRNRDNVEKIVQIDFLDREDANDDPDAY